MAKKKVVVTQKKAGKKVVAPTVSSSTKASSSAVREPKLFGKRNYQLLALGAGLILLGMLLMLGGKQVDPNTWDESVIYSKRITVLAPMVILSGLIVEIYAIFTKNPQ